MQLVSTSSDMPKGYHFNFRNNFYKSLWVRFIATSAVTIGLASRVNWSKGFLTPGRISLVAVVILGACMRKYLAFEALLVMQVVKSRFGKWEWCSCIDEDKEIYLSALPLEEMGYKDWLEEHQFSVLSLAQPFEKETATIVGKHAQFIPQIGYQASDPEDLAYCADWINRQVEVKKNILIYDSGGVGKSALALAAYYVKYEKKTAEEARNFVAEKRPYIFKPGSQHMKRLEEFAKQKPSSSSNPCLSNVCKQQ